jgi:hypothetical protein
MVFESRAVVQDPMVVGEQHLTWLQGESHTHLGPADDLQ